MKKIILLFIILLMTLSACNDNNNILNNITNDDNIGIDTIVIYGPGVIPPSDTTLNNDTCH